MATAPAPQFNFTERARDIDLNGTTLVNGEIKSSPYAFQVGRWEKIQGEMIASSGVNDIRAQAGLDPLHAEDLTDSFAALFAANPKLAANGPAAAKAWWQDYLQSEQGRKLRRLTVWDYDATEIASWSAASALRAYLQQCSEDAGTDQESDQERRERQQSASNAANEGVEDNELGSNMAGRGSGSSSSRIDRADLYQAFQRAKNSSFIRQVLNSGGRMLRYALSRRKEYLEGKEQSNGITTGRKVSRLTASERVKLMNPDTQESVIKRLESGTALLKHKVQLDDAGKGPVVAIVDESGSMRGTRAVQAKGIACTLAWLARVDKRWISLVGFSCDGDVNVLTMAPHEWDQVKLMDWVEHFYDGGTSFDVLPTIAERWQEMGCPPGKTDLLFITDGHGYINDDRLELFQKWRRENNVYSMGLSIESTTDGFDRFCDEAWVVDEISEEEAHTQRVLKTTAAHGAS